MKKIRRDDEVIVIAGKDKGKRRQSANRSCRWQADRFWYQYDQETSEA